MWKKEKNGWKHYLSPKILASALMLLGSIIYSVAGFALTYIAIKTKSLETTIGAHAANNMFLALHQVCLRWSTVNQELTLFGRLLPLLFLISYIEGK
ncbi:type II CAAX prenyl endopeptidase Rce1 family protein [Priestia aryabhattai]|uniref:CPBP family glutamic-type intramembrane protease n=1 Tax=Priestia megaterium TaxID=1404 RepID=UPI0039B8978C